MKIAFEVFSPEASIPVREYLKNKKLQKYFSRETAAAFVCLGKMLNGASLDPQTPFYYSHGVMEHEDYGLKMIAESSRREEGGFSNELFITKAMPMISPLTQFKVLYNMTQCFISIEWGLKGDSAVTYSSVESLLAQVIYCPCASPVLIGAEKIYADGTVEIGFALLTKDEIRKSAYMESETDAMEFFRDAARRSDGSWAL